MTALGERRQRLGSLVKVSRTRKAACARFWEGHETAMRECRERAVRVQVLEL